MSLAPANHYNTFVKNLGFNVTGSPSDVHSDLYHAHIRVVHGARIGILSINTAWTDVGVKPNNGLLFAELVLEEGLDSLKDTSFKLLLHHHPLSDFQTANEYNLKDTIHNKFNLVLLGHRHKLDRSVNYSANGGILRIACSAAVCTDTDAQVGY